MIENLRSGEKSDRLLKRRGPRFVAVRAMPMASVENGKRFCSRIEFDSGITAFGVALIQDWLAEGVCFVDSAGVIRLRKECT